MSNKDNYNTIPTHLEDEVLLAYLDGELSEEEKTSAVKHLEDCWACRSNLKVIQDNIDNFMTQRQEVLLPPELPPTEPALKIFQNRLHNFKSHSHPVSAFNFAVLWKRFYPANILQGLTKIRTSRFFPLPVQVGSALLAVVAITALVFNLTTVQIVSAGDLLKNTEEAQRKEISQKVEPVFYQKLQVRRSKNNAAVESVNWETWLDTGKNNFREAVETEAGRQFVADKYALQTTKTTVGSLTLRPEMLKELSLILEFNHMNPGNPLSAGSFKAWRDSLGQKQEEVTKTSAADGDKSFELKVVPLEELSVGQIIHAAYSVRAHDWTPLALKLEVKQPDGTLSFEIVQQKLEVLALNQLPSEVFPKVENIASVEPNPKVYPLESPSPMDSSEVSLTEERNANTASAETANKENRTGSENFASADLEVEVLRLLNTAKADLDEHQRKT